MRSNGTSRTKWYETIIIHGFLTQHYQHLQFQVRTFYKSAGFPPKEVCKISTNPQTKECKKNLDMTYVYNASTDGILKHFNKNLPEKTNIQHYIHIVHNGYVDHNGAVTSGGLDIVPFQCKTTDVSRHTAITPPEYEEVFTITQYWGGGYFHSNIEDVPRLGPYVDFLIANPQIHIHVSTPKSVSRAFSVLGLSAHRLVSGNVRAKLLYLPPGGGCGWLRPLAGLALAERYQQYITSKHPPEELEHNVIILIKRSAKRWLASAIHRQVANHLEKAAKQHNMTLWVFNDHPLPSYDVTMAMFYRARLIIAPHGAGLSNILFTSPGATVVEVLCNHQPNGCYYNSVQTLGHAYIGLLARRGPCGPMSIDMGYFRQVTNSVLTEISSKRG